MNEYYLTDEEIHGHEEDEYVTELKSKIEKLEEKVAEMQDRIDEAKIELKNDVRVNKRCLNEAISDELASMIALVVRFDQKIIDLLECEKDDKSSSNRRGNW